MAKRIAAGCLAAALCAGLAFPAMAGSPEFARSAQEWAQLRDDKLEFGEIAGLVHEYNNTVIQNQMEYEDYRGEDKDDIADDYYDAADDIRNSIEYPAVDDANYASGLSAALSSELQADKLQEQGDDNIDDGDIKKLGYDKTEAELVKQAQELMITYWNQTYSLESLKESEKLAAQSSQSEEIKLAAGMSTQTAVLSAREALSNAQASIITAQSNLDSTRQQLCLMLGWAYGDTVEISQVPEPDLAAMDAVDLEADIVKGLENNFDLKITQRRVENATAGYTKSSQEQTLKSQREAVSGSVKSAYNDMMLAKSDYEQAKQAYDLAKADYEAASRKLAAGVMTQNAFNSQESSYRTAQVNVKTSELALLTAQVGYYWAVNGLAASS